MDGLGCGRNENTMKIWFISDTHNKHESLRVPKDLDVVIHCGDESMRRKTHHNEPEARAFFEWYAGLDIPTNILISVP